MFLALFILNIFHPGRVLVGPHSEFPRLTRAEKKRLKQEKRAEKAARKAGKTNRGKEMEPLQETAYEPSRTDSFDSLRRQEAGMPPSPIQEDHVDGYLSGSYGVNTSTHYEPLR